MIITLNRDEVISLVKKQLWRLGVNVSEIEGTDQITLDTEVGFINGDLAVVVGVNEDIPEGLFDVEELHDASDDADDNQQEQEDQPTDKPAKQVKRRKRRTRAEIEADEAAAKQAAETQQPQQASGEAAGESQDAKQPETEAQEAETVLETQPEAGADQTQTVEATAEEAKPAEPAQQTESADDNLFAPTHTEPAGSVAEAAAEPVEETEVVTAASANPFGGDAHADADNLFAPTDSTPAKQVTETEGGFAKPREDDDALNLFS